MRVYFYGNMKILEWMEIAYFACFLKWFLVHKSIVPKYWEKYIYSSRRIEGGTGVVFSCHGSNAIQLYIKNMD